MAKKNETPKKKYTALVLQGGGAMGAYEYGVVKALYEQEGFSPDIISGISIGAVNAGLITGAKNGPIEGLAEFWDTMTMEKIPFVPQQMQIMMSQLANPAFYNMNPKLFFNPFSATSFKDTTPLHNTLAKIIDVEKLNNPNSPNLVMMATNIADGVIEEFDNRKRKISIDHIVANTGVPPNLPMTEINKNYYWDGGIITNNPLSSAINRLEELGDENSEREVIYIELFKLKGEIPRNMNDVMERYTQMLYSSKIFADVIQFNKLNSYIDMIREIEKELPQDSKLRNSEGFKRLMNYKKIDKLTVFKYSAPNPLIATADFTQETIKQRIEMGYRDAKHQLSI